MIRLNFCKLSCDLAKVLRMGNLISWRLRKSFSEKVKAEELLAVGRVKYCGGVYWKGIHCGGQIETASTAV
jgi:hypothetical protein